MYHRWFQYQSYHMNWHCSWHRDTTFLLDRAGWCCNLTIFVSGKYFSLRFHQSCAIVLQMDTECSSKVTLPYSHMRWLHQRLRAEGKRAGDWAGNKNGDDGDMGNTTNSGNVKSTWAEAALAGDSSQHKHQSQMPNNKRQKFTSVIQATLHIPRVSKQNF